jgi:hypothetical protein
VLSNDDGLTNVRSQNEAFVGDELQENVAERHSPDKCQAGFGALYAVASSCSFGESTR